MRVTTLKAGKAGLAALIDYYAGLAADQLRRDGAARGPIDYYLDPDEPPGRWWGQGCTAVELTGEVQPEQLAALLEARHPGHGGRLGRGFGAKSARAFDATFSAPKSASLLWALSPDPWVRAEVLAAHDTAGTHPHNCRCSTKRSKRLATRGGTARDTSAHDPSFLYSRARSFSRLHYSESRGRLQIRSLLNGLRPVGRSFSDVVGLDEWVEMGQARRSDARRY